ncbi:hypothetical protein [Terasakiella sp. SH-1]|uniref:hypothetical protein n=1 Tax=Terasakiella sp. SH-1 TaxID=2560057 RepID=UPI001073B5E0|nr:hypothetical protein [Terasakiella sp. SH-1]
MKSMNDVCGYDIIKMRDIFRNFRDIPIEHKYIDGKFELDKKQFDRDFLIAQLSISSNEATHLLDALVKDGWLEVETLTPTTQGMALINFEDRPRLSRKDAQKIMSEILEWAEKTNNVKDARIKIKSIDLFGSYLSSSPDLGDIDLILEFNTLDLPDLEPEDEDLEEQLVSEVMNISEYISLHSAYEKLSLVDATFEKIFP